MHTHAPNSTHASTQPAYTPSPAHSARVHPPDMHAHSSRTGVCPQGSAGMEHDEREKEEEEAEQRAGAEEPQAGGEQMASRADAADDAPGTKERSRIYRLWAERHSPGQFSYHGTPRYGPTRGLWELLEPEWVETNFGPAAGFPTYLSELRANGGLPRVVPKGRAALRSSTVAAALGSHGVIGDARSGTPTSVAVPGGVVYQGELQYCSSYGPASALAACGFDAAAALLVKMAPNILACTTSQAKKVVDVLNGHGGWSEPDILDCSRFNPVVDRSERPTIVQINDGESNEHIIGIAGDFVYNSNWHDRRRLSKEVLDACCLDGRSFKHASYAARLCPGKQLRKRARKVLAEASELNAVNELGAKQPRLSPVV